MTVPGVKECSEVFLGSSVVTLVGCQALLLHSLLLT